MTYKDLLTRYGQPSTSASHTINLYFQDPKSLTTAAEVAHRDKWVEDDIARLERYVEAMKDYRKALAERYAQLETMSYTYLLKLERYPRYDGRKEYILTITKTMEDGTEQAELREVYPGKERRNAIARYEQLKKQRPGIQYELDIEKRQWER